ncbi:hypothetical protein C8R45DRAFT_920258 [Mycena sanguinolenta]|nr:hypothetical protein C8R45DRAFT_920258 [Mycena sanguinolenta]
MPQILVLQWRWTAGTPTCDGSRRSWDAEGHGRMKRAARCTERHSSGGLIFEKTGFKGKQGSADITSAPKLIIKETHEAHFAREANLPGSTWYFDFEAESRPQEKSGLPERIV